MTEYNVEAIEKFFGTPGRKNAGPGHCSEKEIADVKKYLADYIAIRDIYVKAMDHEPVGLTLESNMDTIAWYERRFAEEDGGSAQ